VARLRATASKPSALRASGLTGAVGLQTEARRGPLTFPLVTSLNDVFTRRAEESGAQIPVPPLSNDNSTYSTHKMEAACTSETSAASPRPHVVTLQERGYITGADNPIPGSISGLPCS
jgi:hypothetical protein